MTHRGEAPTFRTFFDMRVRALLGEEGDPPHGLRIATVPLGRCIAMGDLHDNHGIVRRRVLTVSRAATGLVTLGVVLHGRDISTHTWRTTEEGLAGRVLSGAGEEDLRPLNAWAQADTEADRLHLIEQEVVAGHLNTLRGARPTQDLLTDPGCRDQFLLHLLLADKRALGYDPVVEMAARPNV
jgi:hypothetical protein